MYIASSVQVAIEFPYVFTQSMIYSTIFYSMAQFEWTFLKFVWYIFFMYFTMLYFTFYGMMTTAITPNHNVAAIIAAPFYMLWNLFSGFMIPHKVNTDHSRLGSLVREFCWVWHPSFFWENTHTPFLSFIIWSILSPPTYWLLLRSQLTGLSSSKYTQTTSKAFHLDCYNKINWFFWPL